MLDELLHQQSLVNWQEIVVLNVARVIIILDRQLVSIFDYWLLFERAFTIQVSDVSGFDNNLFGDKLAMLLIFNVFIEPTTNSSKSISFNAPMTSLATMVVRRPSRATSLAHAVR